MIKKKRKFGKYLFTGFLVFIVLLFIFLDWGGMGGDNRYLDRIGVLKYSILEKNITEGSALTNHVVPLSASDNLSYENHTILPLRANLSSDSYTLNLEGVDLDMDSSQIIIHTLSNDVGLPGGSAVITNFTGSLAYEDGSLYLKGRFKKYDGGDTYVILKKEESYDIKFNINTVKIPNIRLNKFYNGGMYGKIMLDKDILNLDSSSIKIDIFIGSMQIGDGGSNLILDGKTDGIDVKKKEYKVTAKR